MAETGEIIDEIWSVIAHYYVAFKHRKSRQLREIIKKIWSMIPANADERLEYVESEPENKKSSCMPLYYFHNLTVS